MRLKELRPIRESTEDYEAIEERIKTAFFDLLYRPLLRELQLPATTIKNAKDVVSEALLAAIQTGRVTFSMGAFRGRFSAEISRELRRLGATWDRRTATWRMTMEQMTVPLRTAITASEYHFKQRLEAIDRQILQATPEKIADQLRLTDLFERALWKVERDFGKTVAGITLKPELTVSQLERVAAEWRNNMDLWVKNFAAEEIVSLRKDVQASFFAGNRYESMVKSIQKSYGVTVNKARFLASQETRLLMTTYKKSRYLDAGIPEYRWRCVVGSPKHPVRPAHKALDGKLCRWDDPPITSEPGQPVRRNNAGADYNCRCAAIPVIRAKENK